MASRYSWSSKRSYKNGYVWHDLCEHDLIFPVHGNEYVLKGSEFHEDDSTKVPKPLKQVPSPTCESSSSSSIMNKKTEHEDDSSSSPSPYKKHGGVVDASTQTEVVPSKDGYADDGDRSCTGSSPSYSDDNGVTETTLETLIRGDATRIGSFRLDRDEGMKLQKLKPGNVLIQLISCGSVAVKDHNFGLIPIYGTGLSRPPLIDGELDLLPENSGLMRLKLEDKAYFSGSLVETTTTTTAMSSNPPPSLKRSSSYGAERRKAEDHEKRTSAHVRCIPRSMKREKRADSMRSPLSEAPRKSSGRMTAPSSSSASSSARPSKRIDSFLEDDHDVINIEERLPSGARVIIRSKT